MITMKKGGNADRFVCVPSFRSLYFSKDSESTMAHFILSVKIVRKSETWYTENKKSFDWKRGTDFETISDYFDDDFLVFDVWDKCSG
jgi:hypothetical protein